MTELNEQEIQERIRTIDAILSFEDPKKKGVNFHQQLREEIANILGVKPDHPDVQLGFRDVMEKFAKDLTENDWQRVCSEMHPVEVFSVLKQSIARRSPHQSALFRRLTGDGDSRSR